jgi:ribosomal protein L11 methyltransferase
MPYRIDLPAPRADAFDRLVALGALDVEMVGDVLAAILPDAVDAERLARDLRVSRVSVSPAVGRDDDSVWTLAPRTIRAGRVTIAPAGDSPTPGTIRMIDGPAFGTGGHPTTALCLDVLDSIPDDRLPPRVLDIGIGSGVLALAALSRGVARAVGVDLEAEALQVSMMNARLNGLADRLLLVRGGPDGVSGSWPLVFANVLAAPLMDMAAVLVQRVSHEGRLVLSGIQTSLAADVSGAYRRLGMRVVATPPRGPWTAVVLAPTW